MRNLLVRALMLGLIAISAPALAASSETDMAKVTCAEAAKEGPEVLVLMMFWIDGYLSAEEDDTVMTNAWLEELGKAVETGCAQHPDKPLLDVVKELTN